MKNCLILIDEVDNSNYIENGSFDKGIWLLADKARGV
jgi:hypothetical protein